MISVHLQGKPFNITVIQVYAPTSNAEEAEVVFQGHDVLAETLGSRFVSEFRIFTGFNDEA